MKLRLIFLLIAALLQAGCVSEYTKVTAPDGTVTETTIKKPAPGSLELGAATLEAIAAREVHATK